MFFLNNHKDFNSTILYFVYSLWEQLEKEGTN